jgi:two-component system response regulator HydG
MGSSSSAPTWTILLSSGNKALSRAIRSAIKVVTHLRLKVQKDLTQALSETHPEEVVLVLLDITQATKSEEIQDDWLTRLAAADLPLATVSWGAIEENVASTFLGHGATAHLELPLDLGKLDCLIEAASLRKRTRGTDELPAWDAQEKLDPFMFQALGRQDIIDQFHRVVPQDTTLLLTGETGTGKTRLARLVHELSPRRAEPFLVIDCGAVSPTLIESEMYGHVKGAFTGADRDRPGKFAAVGRGTLFLDEINSLPLPLQAKLLRAVDDRVFEPVGSEQGQPLQARLIAATNALLDDEVAAGRFRADLFFRINVVGFYLPPLRARRDLIVPLTMKFLTELAARNRPDVRGATAEVLEALQEYNWPGNIRELRNVIEPLLFVKVPTSNSSTSTPRCEATMPHRPSRPALHGRKAPVCCPRPPR